MDLNKKKSGYLHMFIYQQQKSHSLKIYQLSFIFYNEDLNSLTPAIISATITSYCELLVETTPAE